MRHVHDGVPLQAEGDSERCVAEPRPGPHNGLEDGSGIRLGAADHAQDLARRRLLLQGLCERNTKSFDFGRVPLLPSWLALQRCNPLP